MTQIIQRDPAWIRAAARGCLERLAATDAATWRPMLDTSHSDAEARLCEQVHQLSGHFGLDQVAADLLVLCAALAWATPLAGLLPACAAKSNDALFGAFATAIGARPRAVRALVIPGGKLERLADLNVEREDGVHRLWPNREYSDLVDLGSDVALADLMAAITPPARAPTLGLAAFAHLGVAVDTARALLASACEAAGVGVHVVLLGPPGVGKTELALALAHEASSRVVEVPSTRLDGSTRDARGRFHAWENAIHLGVAGGAVVVFDEAEDVMASLLPEGMGAAGPLAKGGFTLALERAPVPTIWVANTLEALDPAYRRRMTLVLEVGTAPKALRVALADRLLADASPAVRAAVAAEPAMSPGLVASTARALSLVRAGGGPAADDAVGVLVRGHAPTFRGGREEDARFDPRAVSFGEGLDVEALAARLHAAGDARVLLHGPPGTGKSAFAQYLARVSGRPVHAHTGADLLSMFVGGTERALASAFADAERAGAVLVLDEVDALLYDRGQAVRAFEASQVAQALVEIEHYRGLLVATSNLLPRIDPAFHRRFDLIVPVQVPDASARARLVTELADELGVQPPDAQTVATLAGLAPGHVAQLRRRWRLVDAPGDTSSLVRALAEVRGAAGRQVGFRAAR